ncbi:inactive hydroxysteroid dehydrogenase-like protein 1 [Anopheles ziemanni]|nr:inactive hydroxysteroid dehydrogenase-like protein 1 [Anopheles ziemanni]
MLCSILTFLGLYSLACWLYENIRTPVLLVVNGIRALVQGNRRSLSQTYGPWAVITGGSDGIGKGYANFLAGQGMKVALVARNEAKLKKVAEEIRNKHGVETKIVVADFSRGESIFDHLERELVSLDIGVLVNNVGVINEKPVRLERMEKRLLWDLINVNMGAATLLCRILIPSMKQRKRGLIINISSLASLAATPYLTVYAATKAYMTSFSDGLREELRPFGLECQTVSPGYVRTSMTEYFAPAEGEPSELSKRVISVSDMIRYAGFTISKADTTTGHWLHGIQTAVLKAFPPSLRLKIFSELYTQLLEEYSDEKHKTS